MKSLVDDIVTLLKAQTYDSYDFPRIVNGYNKSTITYPSIVVTEINNTSYKWLNNKETHSKVSYQLDIYSTDSMFSGIMSTGLSVCEKIASKIDTILIAQFGFKRVTVFSQLEGNDLSVGRITVRYETILDLNNDITYR